MVPCSDKNVISNYLTQLYDKSGCQEFCSSLFQSKLVCEGVSYIDSDYRNPAIGTGHWGNIWNAKYLEIRQKFFL